MKYSFLLIVAIAYLLTSCEDKSEDLGFLIQPSKDRIGVSIDSFHVTTSNLIVDSIYSRGSNFAIGKYSDDIFGSFSADFLTQFKYVAGKNFPDNSQADTLSLVLYYKNFWGDSLSSHEVTVYQLNELFDYEKNYYSNINVNDFCNKQTILGKQVFTAVDKTIPESIRNASNYIGKLRIIFSESLRDEFFNSNSIYSSQSDFLNFFKGVYVTTTFGDGTVLMIDSANIELNYQYPGKTTANVDTTYRNKIIFPANKEITSVTRFARSTDFGSKLPVNDSIVFLHSPAGVFPKVSIPFDRIIDRIPEKHYGTINNVRLVAETALINDDNDYTPPSNVILIKEKDIEKFFSQSLFPATSLGIYAFLGTYNTSTQSYTFNSMADYLRKVLQENSTSELNDYVLIPVRTITNTSGSITSLRHLYQPRGTRLRSGKNTHSPMRLEVTYSKF